MRVRGIQRRYIFRTDADREDFVARLAALAEAGAVTGGRLRRIGGWQAVQDLRRGREAYLADERVLGSSAFVEAVLQAMERREATPGRSRRRQLDLESLVHRVAKSLGVSPGEVRGRSRVGRAPQARQLVAYLWVEHLDRPGSAPARA